MILKNNLVVVFDSWTKGSIHLGGLSSSLRELGFDLLLIHIGSWGHDKRILNEEIINGVLSRDIRYYKRMDFIEILKHENPAAVLFLSTRAFAHMAFNKAAAHLKIPTFHLYHGIVTVQAVGHNQITYRINWQQRIRKSLNVVFKNLFLLIPCYLKILNKTSSRLSEYLGFSYEITQKIFGVTHLKRYVQDTSTNYGIVYINADIHDITSNYRIPTENVLVCGNPDLLRFGFTYNDLVNAGENNFDEVMYIDTGLVKAGLIFNSNEEYLSHLLLVKRVTDELNLNFRFRPHPSHDRYFLEMLSNQNILISTDKSFKSDLKNSRVAIVETTSLALIPPLLGIPILLAKFGRFRGQQFGSLLEDCPFSFDLTEINLLGHFVKSKINLTGEQKLNEWVVSTFGEDIFDPPALKIANFIKQKINYETIH
jgi:hypothetical protein